MTASAIHIADNTGVLLGWLKPITPSSRPAGYRTAFGANGERNCGELGSPNIPAGAPERFAALKTILPESASKLSH
jgi:hypothetical protein